MPQQFASSPGVIYDTLVADNDFMDIVGTYKFKDGLELDAISVLTPGATIQGLVDINGLEVIIHDVGPVDVLPYISEPSDALATWNVYLVLWPPENGTDLMNAINIMLRRFSGAKSINTLQYKTIGVGTSVGAYTQALVTIPQTSVVFTG